jgi:hypothetical protein
MVKHFTTTPHALFILKEQQKDDLLVDFFFSLPISTLLSYNKKTVWNIHNGGNNFDT